MQCALGRARIRFAASANHNAVNSLLLPRWLPDRLMRASSTIGLRSSDGRLVRTARSHILADFADTRARSKPPNHCAGKAGMSWLYLSNPCALLCYTSHTAMRVPPAPGFPCAFCQREGQRICTTQAKARREKEWPCPSPQRRKPAVTTPHETSAGLEQHAGLASPVPSTIAP